jgi:hypothetical protein
MIPFTRNSQLIIYLTMVTTSFSCLFLLSERRLFGQFLSRISASRERYYIYSGRNHTRPVIPAKAGIQKNTGFRIAVRNDKPNKTQVLRYIKSFKSLKRLIVNDVLNVVI